MPNSGSNNLTTYYAKRIIGDTAAESAAKALLQTGTDIATNTWILSRTNRSNTYGIKYVYDNTVSGTNDKIELYGNYLTGNNDTNTPTAWVNLHTGDIYILGKVGIGYNPETSDNTYKLYVNGTSYLNDNARINGNLYFETDKDIYFNYNSTDWPVLENYNNGDVVLNSCGRALFLGYNKTSNTYIYYTNADNSTRTKFFEVNSDGAYALTRFGVNGQDTSYNFYVNGTSNLNGDTRANGHLYFEADKDIYFNYNSTDWPILDNANNGNVSLNACGEKLLLGYNKTSYIYMYYTNSDNSTRTKYFEVNSDGSYALTRFGVAGQSTDYTFYVNGTTNITDTLYLTRTTDAEGTADNKPALIIGPVTGTHLEFDGNEIMAKASATTTSILYLNSNGGQVQVGSGGIYSPDTRGGNVRLTSNWIGFYSAANSTTTRYGYIQANADRMYYRKENGVSTYHHDFNGHIYASSNLYAGGSVLANNGYLYSTANSNTIQIGAQNTGCCHIYNSANIPFAFNRGFLMVNSGDIGSGSYPTGNIIVKANGRISGNGGSLYLGNSNNGGWVYLQDCCSQASGTPWKLTQAGVFTCATVNGAHTNMNGTKRDLQIRYGSATVGYNGTATVNFSPAFSNACLVVIPFCSQFQFAAAQSISVQIVSKSQCKLYQYNVQSVGSNIGYVAFGY